MPLTKGNSFFQSGLNFVWYFAVPESFRGCFGCGGRASSSSGSVSVTHSASESDVLESELEQCKSPSKLSAILMLDWCTAASPLATTQKMRAVRECTHSVNIVLPKVGWAGCYLFACEKLVPHREGVR